LTVVGPDDRFRRRADFFQKKETSLRQFASKFERNLLMKQVLCLLVILGLAAAGAQLVCRANQTALDSDGDGICDALELELGTDPQKPDTDGDGLSDAQELGLTSADDKPRDTDGDGKIDALQGKSDKQEAGQDVIKVVSLNWFFLSGIMFVF
jgi:hypothetical protein